MYHLQYNDKYNIWHCMCGEPTLTKTGKQRDNTSESGFGLISVPMSYLLGGGRVIGQSMLDKSRPLKPVSRTAPSGERYEKPKLVPTKKMDFRKTPQ